MKTHILTHGLNFSQKPNGEVNRTVLGKAVETIGQDLDNMDGRIATVEAKKAVVDLGAGSSGMSVAGKEDGLYAYTDGGEQKFAVVLNGKLYTLQGA